MKQGEYGDRPFWLLIFEIAGLMRERAVQLGSAAETETFLELTISQQRILRHVRQRRLTCPIRLKPVCFRRSVF